MGGASATQRLRDFFERQRIGSDRLELLPLAEALRDYLRCYDRIDVALDKFPYHGTTTTCEALWMGLPVVTLAGTRHVSRVGVSLLTNVGLTELVAKDADDYVEIAAGLAGDLPRLETMR